MKENSLRNSVGGNALIGKLSGNDDDKNETSTLDLNSLVPYANHPFKMYDGERLDDMVRSIKELGVIVPLIVRPIASSIIRASRMLVIKAPFSLSTIR